MLQLLEYGLFITGEHVHNMSKIDNYVRTLNFGFFSNQKCGRLSLHPFSDVRHALQKREIPSSSYP